MMPAAANGHAEIQPKNEFDFWPDGVLAEIRDLLRQQAAASPKAEE
ncbi:MAG: hypothetical protein HFH27_01035 [Clostridiaceae bacterium]|nr:hypothetical protein [Clostridiaceae bacterium]MCI9483030.1 hypothetical protein [Clostridiaceae bacterium]